LKLILGKFIRGLLFLNTPLRDEGGVAMGVNEVKSPPLLSRIRN